MKKKSNKKKILIAVIILIVIGIIGFVGFSFLTSDEKEPQVKILKEISGYGYKLDENDTELYKKEFSNLDKILNSSDINYEEYAMSVAKLFIIEDWLYMNNILFIEIINWKL